jgi:hypothetical protein
MAPTVAVKTALQWFTFAVSTAYQIAQHNKMKREADKRKGFLINKRGEAVHIPVVYGKQALGLIEANHKTANSFTYSAPGAAGTEWFSKNTFLNQNRSTNKNSTLIMNGAICQGGIEGVQGFSVDDTVYNRDKKHRHIVHTYNDQLSATAPLGSANAINAIGDDHKFTGLAHTTAAFHLNRDDYNYNGIPNLTFFVKGRKVRPVLENAGNYTLGGYIYSNNPAWCLLDYLLADHGRSIDVSEIDLESFYNAGTICNTVKMTGATVAGTVNGEYPIEAYNNQAQFPDVTSDDTNEDTYYKALDTGNFYTFTQTGTEEIPNGTYSSATLGTRNIPLYECNIVLDSEATVRDNIEAILNTMPLAVMTWTSDGKYKLQLEYPSNQTALEALAVKTFNNNNVIRDTVDLQWSSASERYSSVTVTFLNEHEDFAEDSKTWPDKSTTAGTNLYNSLLAEDNNQPMSTDIRLTGVTDPYHALAHAEQIGRQSRTAHALNFIATKDAIGLEPGDFIKVELPLSDIDAVYRVNSTEISEDLTVKIDAFYVDINSYAWNVSDNDNPGTTLTNPTNFDPDLISNLTWTTTALYNGVASGNLSWTAANSDVLYYIVQASNDNQTTWFDLGTTTGTTFDVTALAQGSYHWGVRTVGPNGQISDRVVDGPYSLTYTGPLTQDYIYGTTSTQDTNTQSYDDNLSESSYPYVAVIDYKPDEPPTLPVRSSGGITLNFLPRTAKLITQVNIYRRSVSAPSTPSGGSYDFTTSTLTPPSGWFTSVPVGVGPVYQANGQAEGLSATTNASIGSWSTPAVIGAEGSNGSNGDTVVTGKVYYQTLQASAPSTPSATSYDTSTGAFTGLTSGWSQEQPTVDVTDTALLEWSSIFVIIEDSDSNQTFSFSTPSGSAQFTTDIESDNYVAGTSGWKLERDTGNAEFGSAVIRGTLSVGQIPNGLDQSKITGLVSDLTTAQSTANTAVSDASTAQSTANTAVSNASTAQGTANTAVSNASTAQTTANTAVSNASTAQTTADTAVSDAATAQTTANAAETTANSAETTANTAYTTAIGKIKSYYQSSTPTASAVGDIWFNTSEQKNYYWTGSSWQAVSLTADSIAANYVYAGSVNASQINAGTINANRIPTMATNQFTTMSGLYGVRSGDTDSPAGTGTIATLTYTPSSASSVLLTLYLDVTFEQRPGGEGSYGFGVEVYLNNALVISTGGGASTDGAVSAKIQGFHSFTSTASQQTIQVRWRQFNGRKGRMTIHSGFVAGLFTQT